MRALYLDWLPMDVEERDPATGHQHAVMGARVHGWEVVAALLRHGSYDRYYFPAEPAHSCERFQRSGLAVANADRIRILSKWEVGRLADEEALVLFTHGPNLDNLSALRARIGRPDVPVAGLTHSLHSADILRRLMLMMLSPLGDHDALICPSRAGCQVVENLIQTLSCRYAEWSGVPLTFPAALPIIPHGVDTDSFAVTPRSTAAGALVRHKLSIPQSATVILYFGRLSDRSKADLRPLLIAFNELQVNNESLFFLIGGHDGQLQSTEGLRQFAGYLGCESRVHVVPNPDPDTKRALYAAADIFVSPSDSLQETYGLTLVEASASGLPIVASDWNGYKDLVLHGETGFLVKTLLPGLSEMVDDWRIFTDLNDEDIVARSTVVDVDQLVAFMGELIANPILRHDLGSRGRERAVATFDHRVIVRQYENLWERGLNRGHERGLDGLRRTFDWHTCSHSVVFGHYSTGSLSDTDTIVLTPTGRRWVEDGRDFGVLRSPASWFSSKALELLADRVHSTGGLTVQLATECVLNSTLLSESTRVTARAHVARLLKCGLARVSDSRFAGGA